MLSNKFADLGDPDIADITGTSKCRFRYMQHLKGRLGIVRLFRMPSYVTKQQSALIILRSTTASSNFYGAYFMKLNPF